MDSTGTVWPIRQNFLVEQGLNVAPEPIKSFGMNWKMTAKTTLVQLHHKIQTLEHINRYLVLVAQDHLLEYMKDNFRFGHLESARLGDSMHFHVYQLKEEYGNRYRLNLSERLSTDADGIAECLGLQADPRIEISTIIALLESKITKNTLLSLQQ